MKKHTFKEWFGVTRYWSFPVSVMPVIVTFAYLFSTGRVPEGGIPYLYALAAIIGVVILHSAGNVLSDYFDYKKGVDNEEAFAVQNLVFHRFEPKEYLIFSIILFAAGSIIGILLSYLSGWGLLAIGIIGVILTAMYALLKFNALGDANIFIVFSILIILGTSYVVCGEIVYDALVLAIPIGIITVSVLHANNTLDIDSDRKAGIKTFAMILGGHTSCVLYKIYMIIPFVCIIASVACGYLHPMSLLSLVAAVPAYMNIKSASHFREKGIQTMSGLDQGSAKLQLVFSGLLSIGLFLSVLF